MSYATAVTWLFNFIVALTFPRLLYAFKPQGAFGWYAGWNMIGWFLILLFVPETKALSLEELDQGEFGFFFSVHVVIFLPPVFRDGGGGGGRLEVVILISVHCSFLSVFNVPTRKQAAYGLASLPHALQKYVLRRRVPDQPPPYDDGGYVKSDAKMDGMREKERDRVV